MRQDFAHRALAIVDAAYGLDHCADAWLLGVLRAALPALDQGLGLYGLRFRLTDAGTVRLDSDPLELGPVPSGYGDVLRTADTLPPEAVSVSWADPMPFDTASGAHMRAFPREDIAEFARSPVMASSRPFGVHDATVAKMIDADGQGLLLCAPMGRARLVDEEPAWRFVMTHLLAGLRLRAALLADDDGEAVLLPGGKIVHAGVHAQTATARDALRSAALTIDRARTRSGTRDPLPILQAWRGLVSGRWSLVDRFDHDGRRYLVARRNDPRAPFHRALSERERQVAMHAALGHSNKQIAYALGLAPSTISSHLRSAMRRLGVRDIASLTAVLRPRPRGNA